jgi:hypothetical protein
MTTPITPQDIVNCALSICAAIITIATAVKIVTDAIKKFKEPEMNQDSKISEIEKRLELHDEYLANDKAKIESIEAGNKVTQQAILALLSHAINGDSKDQLEKAKTSLTDYLINR